MEVLVPGYLESKPRKTASDFAWQRELGGRNVLRQSQKEPLKSQRSGESRSLSNGARGFQAIKIFFLVGFEMGRMPHNGGRVFEPVAWGDLPRLRNNLSHHVCRADERG